MTRQNRIVAAVLTAITVLVLLSSSAFIVEHADHDCTGDGCLICEQIYSCAQNLKNLTIAAMVMMAMVAFSFALQAVMGQAKYAEIPHTPVNLKVKLSN